MYIALAYMMSVVDVDIAFVVVDIVVVATGALLVRMVFGMVDQVFVKHLVVLVVLPYNGLVLVADMSFVRNMVMMVAKTLASKMVHKAFEEVVAVVGKAFPVET